MENKMQLPIHLNTYLETDNGNPPELPTIRKLHTINFSNGATSFKEAPNIVLSRVVWNASHINFCRNIHFSLTEFNKNTTQNEINKKLNLKTNF